MSNLAFRNDEPDRNSCQDRVASYAWIRSFNTRNILLAALLIAATAFAWREVVQADAAMSMPGAAVRLSLSAAATFTLQWGVMMTAMMLPSAAPMIILYRAVSQRHGLKDQVIPAELFALIYLALWLATGIPVYVASVWLQMVAAKGSMVGAMPFALSFTLLLTGLYQMSPAKRACLRECLAPVDFLMRRWRSGYTATVRLAAIHAAFCIGCCWALMLLLVAAGSMSLLWVLAISVLVFAEKVLPGGERTAQVTGLILIAGAIAVAVRPELAGLLGASTHHEGMRGH